MGKYRLAVLQVHLAVLLFGLAGLFGKFLELPATIIVLGRTGFAALTLGVWLACYQLPWKPANKKDWGGFALLGGLLAFHWFSFFYSIQLSTVAIGLLTFSSFPIFVTLLEPWWFGLSLRRRDGLAVLIVLAGVAMVIPEYNLATNATLGALWGLGAGLSFAVLQLLNKRYRDRYGAVAIAFHQDSFAFLSLLLVSPLGTVTPTPMEWGWLALLGIVCTALAHTLFIESLAALRTQLASIISTLEPVYGILLAVALLGEIPNLRVLIGGGLIIGTTTLATYWDQN